MACSLTLRITLLIVKSTKDINQSIPAGINCSCDVTNELTIHSAIKHTLHMADSHITGHASELQPCFHARLISNTITVMTCGITDHML
jgi:hypothetical protein